MISTFKQQETIQILKAIRGKEFRMIAQYAVTDEKSGAVFSSDTD